MRLLPRLLLAGAAALLPPAAPTLATGIPVIDAAALSQQLQELMNWARQLQAMAEQLNALQTQIDQAQRQIEQVSGARSVGQILNSGAARAARDYLPPEWDAAMGALGRASTGRYGTLGDLARQVREAADSLDQTLRTTPAGKDWEEDLELATGSRVLGEAAYDRSGARVGELNQLVDAIGTAAEPKDIWDLQARLQAETNFILNDLARQMAAMQALDGQEAIRQAKTEARRLNSMDTTMGRITGW